MCKWIFPLYIRRNNNLCCRLFTKHLFNNWFYSTSLRHMPCYHLICSRKYMLSLSKLMLFMYIRIYNLFSLFNRILFCCSISLNIILKLMCQLFLCKYNSNCIVYSNCNSRMLNMYCIFINQHEYWIYNSYNYLYSMCSKLFLEHNYQCLFSLCNNSFSLCLLCKCLRRNYSFNNDMQFLRCRILPFKW